MELFPIREQRDIVTVSPLPLSLAFASTFGLKRFFAFVFCSPKAPENFGFLFYEKCENTAISSVMQIANCLAVSVHCIVHTVTKGIVHFFEDREGERFPPSSHFAAAPSLAAAHLF